MIVGKQTSHHSFDLVRVCNAREENLDCIDYCCVYYVRGMLAAGVASPDGKYKRQSNACPPSEDMRLFETLPRQSHLGFGKAADRVAATLLPGWGLGLQLRPPTHLQLRGTE